MKIYMFKCIKSCRFYTFKCSCI